MLVKMYLRMVIPHVDFVKLRDDAPPRLRAAAGKNAHFRMLSVARAPEADVAGRGAHFQHWPPAIQLAFCGQRLRTPLAALTS